MRIVYRQSNEKSGLLERLGVKNFFLKELKFPDDEGDVLSKEHHHTCFEIHFLKSGRQTYELGGKSTELSCGELIFICPYVKHKVRGADEGIRYSVTFELSGENGRAIPEKNTAPYFTAPISENIKNSIERILAETEEKAAYYSIVAEGRAAEIVSG